MNWARRPLTAPALAVIQAMGEGLTVATIATPRDELRTGLKTESQTLLDVEDLKAFDHIPVTEGKKIVGVLVRKAKCVQDLSEAMLMAADASLLSFLEVADHQPFVLLVRERQIAGMVTLSDIQKLPVYCLIYALLISVEMLLRDWIRSRSDSRQDDWINALGASDKKRIGGYWKRSQAANTAIDKLSCASFEQAIKAALKLGLFSTDNELSRRLRSLKDLRDMVCHGKDFALDPKNALQIPNRVRDAQCLRQALETAIAAK